MFVAFFRIGLFTFGGGYAMLPMLQKEIVDNRKWTSEEQLIDYFSISQCTPGVIAVNIATFIGTKRKGIIGAIVATIGVILPSVIIITLIAMLISNFAELEVVKHAFSGVRACVCALMLSSILRISKKSVVDKNTLIIFLSVLILTVIFSKVSPVVFIIFAGCTGVLLGNYKEKNKKN